MSQMAKIAIQARDDFAKFGKLNKEEKAKFKQEAKEAHDDCIKAFEEYADKENITQEEREEFLELIRESIVCESIYLSPKNPSEAHPVCVMSASKVYSFLFRNAKESKHEKIKEYLSTRSDDEAKREVEDIMPVLRFFVKYHSVGTDNEDEQLQ